MKKFKFILAVILLPLVLWLISLQAIIYDIDVYNEIFEKVESPPRTAEVTTLALFDFFQDKGTLDSVNIFNDREKQHLHDVKGVLNGFLFILPFLVVLEILLLYSLTNWRKALFYGSLITVVLPLLLALFPFYESFYNFHLLFFEPGSFVFPTTSYLIIIYPLEFFSIFTTYLYVISSSLALLIGLNTHFRR